LEWLYCFRTLHTADSKFIKPAPRLQDFKTQHTSVPGQQLTPEERKIRAEELRKGSQQFKVAMVSFSASFLFTATIIGFLEIVGGAFLPLAGIAPGLIVGGVLTILSGNLIGWTYSTASAHFASLLAGLIGVILVGVRIQRPVEPTSA
jgi:hypothetical protein